MTNTSSIVISMSLVAAAFLWGNVPATSQAKPIYPQSQTRTFHYPQIKGYYVDHCLLWARKCDWPAANRFCQLMGYSRAKTWKWEYLKPTIALGSGEICNLRNPTGCGGFSKIVCIRAAGGASGRIIARVVRKEKCIYRSGGRPSTNSNHRCPVRIELVNTTNKEIHWSSGWMQGQNPWGGGTWRQRIGYPTGLQPGKRMRLGGGCIIAHGRAFGTLTMWGTGRHHGNPDKHQFKWRIEVRCP